MDASTTVALTTAGITNFWTYVSGLFPVLLTFVIAVAVIGVVFWLVARTIRHIF